MFDVKMFDKCQKYKKIVLKFRCVRQNAGTNMAFILVVVRFDDEIFQNT